MLAANTPSNGELLMPGDAITKKAGSWVLPVTARHREKTSSRKEAKDKYRFNRSGPRRPVCWRGKWNDYFTKVANTSWDFWNPLACNPLRDAVKSRMQWDLTHSGCWFTVNPTGTHGWRDSGERAVDQGYSSLGRSRWGSAAPRPAMEEADAKPGPPEQTREKVSSICQLRLFTGPEMACIPQPFRGDSKRSQLREGHPRRSWRARASGKQGLGTWRVREQGFLELSEGEGSGFG